MDGKHMVAGVALVGSVVASMAGGVGRAAHSDAPAPYVDATWIQPNPLAAEARGSGFTPGGAVHLDLVLVPITQVPNPGGGTPVPENGTPRVVGSLDTRAARTTYVRNGHGIVFTRAGGYFDAEVDASSPTCGEFGFWLIATDVATGASTTSNATGTGATCT